MSGHACRRKSHLSLTVRRAEPLAMRARVPAVVEENVQTENTGMPRSRCWAGRRALAECLEGVAGAVHRAGCGHEKSVQSRRRVSLDIACIGQSRASAPRKEEISS